MKPIPLIIFFSLSFYFSIHAQEMKLRKVKKRSFGGDHKMIYHLKKDSEEEKIKEGGFESWYKKKLLTKGQYKNNQKTGVWNYYSYLEDLEYSGRFEKGLKQGLWKYKLYGRKSAEVYYTNNVMDSAFGYFPNYNKSYEVKYYSDSSGVCISYYENGKMHEYIPLFNKKIHGLATIYFDNGLIHRQTIYRNSQPTDVISCYDYRGNIRYGGSLKDGNGDFVQYYLTRMFEDDNLRIYSLEYLKDGKYEGEASYLRRNGLPLKKGKFKKGKKSGVWTFYNKNGAIVLKEEHYIDSNKYPLPGGSSFPYWINNSVNHLGVCKYQEVPVHFIHSKNQEKKHLFAFEYYLKIEPFIQENLRTDLNYESKAAQKYGVVLYKFKVTFAITQSGECKIIYLSEGPEIMKEEIKRVLNIMPRWNPGLYLGVPYETVLGQEFNFEVYDLKSLGY